MIPGNIPKSDAIELDDDPSPLRIPDVAGLSLAAAALAYAKAGWYVLPTDPADIKNPGSVVHGHWQDKSTREPEQIRAWWRESPGNGIALHLGKSGAVAFDLDIDDLDVIARAGRPDIAEALRSAVVIQTTRRQGDRGHYQWKRVGALHRLPEALRTSLLAAAGEADPLTKTELEQFLDTYAGGGCGREDCRNSPKGPVTKFKNQIAEGCSRHDTMASVLPWAFSEAMAGCYSAREACEQRRTPTRPAHTTPAGHWGLAGSHTGHSWRDLHA